MSDDVRVTAYVEIEHAGDERRHGFKMAKAFGSPEEARAALQQGLDTLARRIAEDGGWR